MKSLCRTPWICLLSDPLYNVRSGLEDVNSQDDVLTFVYIAEAVALGKRGKETGRSQSSVLLCVTVRSVIRNSFKGRVGGRQRH